MGHYELRYYEDVVVGEEIGPLEKIPDGETVRLLREMSGRSGPTIFNDAQVARREGLPEPIMPMGATMAYLSQLLTSWCRGIWIRKLELIFRRPVFHNRAVKAMGVVTDKSLVGVVGHIECDVYLLNVDGDRLANGRATVTLPRKSQ